MGALKFSTGWGRATGFALLAAGFLSVAFPAGSLQACDVCAVYVATELRETQIGFRLGAAEQMSRFQTLQDDGEEIPSGGQQLTSSTTQVVVGYDFLPEIGVQVNVPLIVREFRRPEDGVMRIGNENGLGDMSILAIGRPISVMGDETMFRLSLLGGLKFPTGSSDRIAEELAEGDEPAARFASSNRAIPRHHDEPSEDGAPPSGIHGHDLALGSGSFDGIVGIQLFGSWKRLFVTAGAQYAIRTEGDFNYQYANELTWSGGPGAYVILEHEYSLSLQGSVTGEYKRNDTLNGEAGDDTAITAVYLGPALAFTWGVNLGADVAVDIPFVQDNSSIQLVPDFRIRGGFSWRI